MEIILLPSVMVLIALLVGVCVPWEKVLQELAADTGYQQRVRDNLRLCEQPWESSTVIDALQKASGSVALGDRFESRQQLESLLRSLTNDQRVIGQVLQQLSNY